MNISLHELMDIVNKTTMPNKKLEVKGILLLDNSQYNPTVIIGRIDGTDYSVRVSLYDLFRWKVENLYIQKVFHYLSAEAREFLLTGYTPQEWEQLRDAEEALEDDFNSRYYDENQELRDF